MLAENTTVTGACSYLFTNLGFWREWWCHSLLEEMSLNKKETCEFTQAHLLLLGHSRYKPTLWVLPNLTAFREDSRVSLKVALEWVSHLGFSIGDTSKKQPKAKSPPNKQTSSSSPGAPKRDEQYCSPVCILKQYRVSEIRSLCVYPSLYGN